MHLRISFNACPMHSPFGFVHLTHQNHGAHALFCHNSLAKVNMQLLIYKSSMVGSTAHLVIPREYTSFEISSLLDFDATDVSKIADCVKTPG